MSSIKVVAGSKALFRASLSCITILKVSAEGGGLTVQGISSPSSWRFRLNYNDSTPELIDEEAINDSSDWFPKLSSVMANCRWPWSRLYPIYIHPIFADQILQLKRELDIDQKNSRPNAEAWFKAVGQSDSKDEAAE